MIDIFLHAIKDKRWSLAIYCLSGIGLLWMYVAFYPSVQASQATVSEFVKTLPEALTKSFGLDPRSFTTFEGFLAGKHFSMVWPILTIAFAASFGANYVAGEIEKGTIELSLSQPISRMKIYLTKYLAGTVTIAFFVIFSVLTIIPMAQAYNIDFSTKSFVLLTILGLTMALAFWGVSMLTSAVFSSKGGANFTTVGILLAMYIINIVALIKPSLDKLKYLSFFHYFNYDGVLLDHQLELNSLVVFMTVFVLSGFIGSIIFNKKDIIT